ncbi:hypothetical protein [Lancefieldella rimae]
MAGIFCRSMVLWSDVFDTLMQSATCGTFMRPSGEPFASDVGEAANSHISAMAFSRGFPPHYPIFPQVPGTHRVASGDVVFRGMACPSSRLASGALRSQRVPKSLIFLSRQAERYLLGGVCKAMGR